MTRYLHLEPCYPDISPPMAVSFPHGLYSPKPRYKLSPYDKDNGENYENYENKDNEENGDNEDNDDIEDNYDNDTERTH